VTPVRRWRIVTTPDELSEGLFGQVLLWVFEILPLLARRGIQPEWDIRSRLYGVGPDWQVLPGIFDVADAAARGKIERTVPLLALRSRGVSALGGDWPALHALWHAYFKLPVRIVQAADGVALPPGCLGVHYRGTDKNCSPLDTNPVAIADMMLLLDEFVTAFAPVPALFVATDEFSFVEAVRERFAGLPVINLGPVPFHKGATGEAGKADRALLDCVLLSRCRAVLKTSSALSGFAKVLNPSLACYRVAASKMFGDVPYFPDAHIPRWAGRSEMTRALLQRQFEGDWRDDRRLPARFVQPFASQPRYSAWGTLLNRAKYRVSVWRGKPRTS